MSTIDPYGRPCSASVPGREREEPGTPDVRTMSNRDRIICVGNRWFIGFLMHLEASGFTAIEIIRVVEKPWKWQKEFEEFLRSRTA